MGRGSEPDLRVAALSRKQHGAWSRGQALRRGMTPTMIRARHVSGEWVRLDHGVYGHVSVPPTWERSLMAAVLAEPWAVVSHRAAAALHELTGYRRGRPEITIRPDANARGRLAIAHRGVDVRTTTVRGVPVVTVAQAFIDLAQVSSDAKVATALSDRAQTSPALLEAIRDRYCELAPRGGRDLRSLRAILSRFGAGQPVERSHLEHRLAQVLTGRGMPEVVWEAPFPGRCPGLQRVDGLLPAWRLVVEGDGRTWHERLEDFERDRRRDAEAAAAGYLTLRFTYHQLTAEARWVRRIVLETGARRTAELRGTTGSAAHLSAPNQLVA
jgi:hypothetical protein